MKGRAQLLRATHERTVCTIVERRVLILGIDSLRPDMVEASSMPRLQGIMEQGTVLDEFHAVYPSETRVNMASLASGCLPGRHGIVANRMYARGVGADGVVDTGAEEALRQLAGLCGGRILHVPALGEVGLSVAVASTGSPGSSLMWSPTRPEVILNPATTYGEPALQILHADLAPLPAKDRHNPEPLATHVTQAFCRHMLAPARHAVLILWLAEVDTAQHAFGLGSPQVRAAMHVADRCLGMVMDALHQGAGPATDVLIVSDHGASTWTEDYDHTDRLLQDLVRSRRQWEATLVPVGRNVFARAVAAPQMLRDLVAAIQEAGFRGVIVSGQDDVPGTHPLQTIWPHVSTPRAPLLSLSPSCSGRANRYGVPGLAGRTEGGGPVRAVHGLASPYDLHALCVALGPSFARSLVSRKPAGAADILPTVAHVLGQDLAVPVEGRIMHEILCQPPPAAPPTHVEERFPAGAATGRDGALLIHRVDGQAYLHGQHLEEG